MSKIDVDADAIRKLAELMKETGLTEIEVGQGDMHIRVGKTPAPVAMAAAPAAAAIVAGAPAAAAGPVAGAVASPMVGAAYLAPAPDQPNFVAVGDKITVGQTLLIIEAMKVMNPIKAEKAGTVTQILVSNGQPVEFGETLMVVE